jgi:hypothetical protein
MPLSFYALEDHMHLVPAGCSQSAPKVQELTPTAQDVVWQDSTHKAHNGFACAIDCASEDSANLVVHQYLRG